MAEKKKDKRSNRSLTDQEKKKIAAELVEGYKKMAALNLELAEKGMTDDETE